MLNEFAQHSSSRSSTLFVLVTIAQFHQYLGPLLDDVSECNRVAPLGCTRWSEAQNIGEYDLGIFSGLEWQSVQIPSQQEQKVLFN